MNRTMPLAGALLDSERRVSAPPRLDPAGAATVAFETHPARTVKITLNRLLLLIRRGRLVVNHPRANVECRRPYCDLHRHVVAGS